MSYTATMNSNFVPKFDILDYVKQLRNVGVSQDQAEIQGKALERVFEVTDNNSKELKAEIKQELHTNELADKKDIVIIEGKIRELELRLQKEIKSLEIKLMSLYGAGFLILLGVLAKGFHWL